MGRFCLRLVPRPGLRKGHCAPDALPPGTSTQVSEGPGVARGPAPGSSHDCDGASPGPGAGSVARVWQVGPHRVQDPGPQSVVGSRSSGVVPCARPGSEFQKCDFLSVQEKTAPSPASLGSRPLVCHVEEPRCETGRENAVGGVPEGPEASGRAALERNCPPRRARASASGDDSLGLRCMRKASGRRSAWLHGLSFRPLPSRPGRC